MVAGRTWDNRALSRPVECLERIPPLHWARQPIVAGWSSQWLAQLSLTRDSGFAPLDVRRVHSSENPHAVAVAPMKSLVDHLLADGVPPLFVLAAGDDVAQRTQGLREVAVAVPVCLRADRGFYADPPPAVPSPKGGRPRRHGAKFAARFRRPGRRRPMST